MPLHQWPGHQRGGHGDRVNRLRSLLRRPGRRCRPSGSPPSRPEVRRQRRFAPLGGHITASFAFTDRSSCCPLALSAATIAGHGPVPRNSESADRAGSAVVEPALQPDPDDGRRLGRGYAVDAPMAGASAAHPGSVAGGGLSRVFVGDGHSLGSPRCRFIGQPPARRASGTPRAL